MIQFIYLVIVGSYCYPQIKLITLKTMFLNHKMLTWRKDHWVLFTVMFPHPPPARSWQHTKTSTLTALLPDLQFENLIYTLTIFFLSTCFGCKLTHSICVINGIKISSVSTLTLSIIRKDAYQYMAQIFGLKKKKITSS